MLFNENYELIFNDFCDMNVNKSNILSPKEGLILGNMFYNEYKPYKNYKPNELVAHNEKEKLMLRIQELSLAVNDLSLHLDLNPTDKEMFFLFKKYTMELNQCVERYSCEYEVLELNQDLKNTYTWYKSPWPWEGGKYV